MFFSKCALCDNQLNYKSQKAANAAVRAQRKCRDCKNKLKLEARQKIFRICCGCNEKIFYPYEYEKERAEKLNQRCIKCSRRARRTENYSGLTRKCPECQKELVYQSIDSCTRANRNNDLCKSCSLKTKGIGPTEQCICNGTRLESNL